MTGSHGSGQIRMSPKHVHVVVVGGGLIGSWTAFFLRKRAVPVAVIEMGAIGAQSSGVNFGNLRLQGRYPGQYPLSLRAHALWEQLELLIGDRCEFEQNGHLYIAFDEQQNAQLRVIAAEAKDHGVASDLLGTAEIRRRWPWLSHEVTTASWSARDATANPRLVTPAVARAAAGLGAEVFQNTKVVAVERRGEGFRVRVDGSADIICEWVVNTAGAWAPAIAEMFGDKVPLFAAGPPQFVTEPLPRFIFPSVQAVDGKTIFRQVDRGNVVFAGYPRGPSDPIRNRAQVPPEKTLAGMRNLARVVPCLGSTHVIRVWSGIEGYLPDMLPVISPSTGASRLLHAFGFCGHGFQLGPGVGAVLADIIADGQTTTPLDAFSVARFHGGKIVSSSKFTAEFDPALVVPPVSGA